MGFGSAGGLPGGMGHVFVLYQVPQDHSVTGWLRAKHCTQSLLPSPLRQPGRGDAVTLHKPPPQSGV